MNSHYNFLVCVRCFTFNHAPYIKDAMDGFCMQQTSFPFVCVIVDDASTDGEQDVIRAYMAKNFNLEEKGVVRNEETDDYTLIYARHKTNTNCFFAVYYLKYNHYSIKKDKFTYFSQFYDHVKYHAQCEGDDYWSKGFKLQMQVDFMESEEDVGMCYTKCRYYYQEKSIFAKNTWGGNAERFETLINENTVPYASVLYRQGLDKRYEADIDPYSRGWMLGDYPIWLWMSKESKVKFIDTETCVYRILEHSASQRDNKEKRIAFITSVVAIQHFFADRYMQSELVKKDKRERALLMDSFSNRDYQSVIHYYHLIDKHDLRMILKYLLSKILCRFI